MLPPSIWETESYFAQKDIIIIGSGFTGLWSAYYLKKKYPEKSITILERGLIPSGASSRNAGFACFGSYTELLYDMNKQGANSMLELVEMRVKGLEKISKHFTKRKIGYENLGGYELVSPDTFPDLDSLRSGLDEMNILLQKITGKQKTFQLSDSKLKSFGIGGSYHLIENKLESQLHSGKLIQALSAMVQSLGVTILTQIEVQHFEILSDKLCISTKLPFLLYADQILICTNAFAKTLLPDLDLVPARGQILLTEGIPDLKIKGSFHFDQGFYYFRNLDNRVLLGGARNKFLKEEETFSTDTTTAVQNELENFLRDTVLPGVDFKIAQRWSGIMAVGQEKKPIVQKINDRVFCAVRMSGMGVALAPQIGKQVSMMM